MADAVRRHPGPSLAVIDRIRGKAGGSERTIACFRRRDSSSTTLPSDVEASLLA